MDEPEETTADDGEASSESPMSDDEARRIRFWSRTIDRWAAAGETCFLITEEGHRQAMPDDVVDANKRLQRRGRSRSD